MTVHDYAICDPDSGEVLQMIYTHRSLEDVQRRFTEYLIKPVEDVPMADLANYQFWTERP